LEIIKQEIEKEGYLLLSDKYTNSTTEIQIKCPVGHTYITKLKNWRNGSRCPYCSVSASYTYDFVKSQFDKEGYILLSDRYKNCSSKLDILCPDNHEYQSNWNSWQQGNRCPICAPNYKKSFEYVKSEIEKEGYKLLSSEYINSKSKIKIQCKNGHKYFTNWDRWNSGCRCQKCYYQSMLRDWSDEELLQYKLYRRAVIYLSETSYKKYKHIINPLNLKRGRGDYHLDHIYSVIDGFKNNVPVDIISYYRNLQMLSEFDNISKNGNSWITLEQLYKEFIR